MIQHKIKFVIWIIFSLLFIGNGVYDILMIDSSSHRIIAAVVSFLFAILCAIIAFYVSRKS